MFSLIRCPPCTIKATDTVSCFKRKRNNRHGPVSTGFFFFFFFFFKYPWGCRVVLLELIPSDTEPEEQKKRGGWLKRSVISFFIRNSSLQIQACTVSGGISRKIYMAIIKHRNLARMVPHQPPPTLLKWCFYKNLGRTAHCSQERH